MATLQEIAELVWKQISSAKDEARPLKEEVIATARAEYAYQFWLKWKQEKRAEGEYEVPSYLLTEKDFDVIGNVIDFTNEKVMRGLEEKDLWLQNVGGFDCKCRYVKSTVNQWQALCDDDSLAASDKVFYVVGKKIKFPLGTHASTITLTYANMGDAVDGETEIDDVLGGIIRRSLLEIYLGKVTPEDKTNNSNPNQ